MLTEIKINVANKVENQDLLPTEHVIAGLC